MESRMLVEKEANHGAQELNLNLQYVRLINRLEAVGSALLIPRPTHVNKIGPGEPVSRRAVAVVAPGYRLGRIVVDLDISR